MLLESRGRCKTNRQLSERQTQFRWAQDFLTTGSTNIFGDLAFFPPASTLSLSLSFFPLVIALYAGPLADRLKITYFTLPWYGCEIRFRPVGCEQKWCIPPLASALNRKGAFPLPLSLSLSPQSGMWSWQIFDPVDKLRHCKATRWKELEFPVPISNTPLSASNYVNC